jgi:hypothetical protein
MVRRRGTGRRAYAVVGIALLAAAVRQQLKRPPAERDWHGTLGGVVPYDLRPPTMARVKASLWSPEDERLLLPRAAGVGWSPNLGRLYVLLRGWRPTDE